MQGVLALVFLTGVPGAGKTLVGLNIAINQKNAQYGASFLSGNSPLVKVLSVALRRNLEKRKKEIKPELLKEIESQTKQKEKETVKTKIAVESIIRNVYPHKEEIISQMDLSDPKNIKLKEGVTPGNLHVIIYDEAQRAWSADKMRKPGNSVKSWQTKEWSLSEPTVLLWDINNKDWGVMVCLIGGGQEINDGESGINEWLRTILEDSKLLDLSKWDIYMSGKLTSPEYQIKDKAGHTFSYYEEKLREKNVKFVEKPGLHLDKCQRTPLSEKLSSFVNKLVEGSAKKRTMKE